MSARVSIIPRGAYHSLHGEIRSAWQREGSRLTWEIAVPPNTSARVAIPCSAEGEPETTWRWLGANRDSQCEGSGRHVSIQEQGVKEP